jgi:hypothetical protein
LTRMKALLVVVSVIVAGMWVTGPAVADEGDGPCVLLDINLCGSAPVTDGAACVVLDVDLCALADSPQAALPVQAANPTWTRPKPQRRPCAVETQHHPNVLTRAVRTPRWCATR